MVKRRMGRVTLFRIISLAVLAAVVAAVVVVSVVAYRDGGLNKYICDGSCPAEFAIAPNQLMLGDGPKADEPARAAGTADKAKVAAAIEPVLKESTLGKSVGFIALDSASGDTLYASGDAPFTPASTTKVLTAFSALSAVGPSTRFATRVVRSSADKIIIVGGGDPYLDLKASKTTPRYGKDATLTQLAERTAKALKESGDTKVTLGFDASLFSGPGIDPKWPKSYVSDNVVTPISALWVNQGVAASGVRSQQPARTAADQFAALLKSRGVSASVTDTEEKAPAGAEEIARVESAPVRQILELMIEKSDNQAADVMFRHVALASGEPGSFEGGAVAVASILKSHQIDTRGLRLDDGSGLARGNLISPLTLAQTLRVAGRNSDVSSLITDLPVAGFNGTMSRRFSGSRAKAGLGIVHAKTGTLTGVNSLAGTVVDADGDPIIFVVMADKTKAVGMLDAEAALDRVAAALAGCHCGR